MYEWQFSLRIALSKARLIKGQASGKGHNSRANSMWSRVTKRLGVSYVYLRSPIHPKTDMEPQYEELFRRLEIEQRQQRQKVNPFPPQQIFELSCEHPIVHNLVEKWQRGDLTWEQALTGMVIYLCATNKSLFQKLTEVIAYNPAPTIISPEMLECLKQQNNSSSPQD